MNFDAVSKYLSGKSEKKQRFSSFSKQIHNKRGRHCIITTIPGEIRNAIYGYVFDSIVIVEFMPSHHTQYLLPYQEGIVYPSECGTDVPTVRYTGNLGKYNRISGMATKWKTSVSGIHLASKLFFRETITFIYRCNHFYFQSSCKLDNFLTVVNGINLKAVTSLSLSHVTYSEPRKAVDRVWKIRHDTKWEATCRKAASLLQNLKSLHIVIKLRENPLKFAFDEAWVQPLLCFSHLPLDIACFKIISDYSDPSSQVHTTIRTPGARHDLVQDIRNSTRKATVCEELHEAFCDAIAARVFGLDEEEALEAYRHLVLLKYKNICKALPFCEHEFVIEAQKKREAIKTST